MKEVIVKVCSFAELNPEAQKEVLEKYRMVGVEYSGWHEFILEYWEERLEKNGFFDAKIHFSGFGSQGDGACFEAHVSVAEWLEKNEEVETYKELFEYDNEHGINCQIETHGRYCHANTMSIDSDTRYFDVSEENEKKAYEQFEEVEGSILSHAKSLAREIYKELEEDFYYRISDEYVKEFIENNIGERFLEDGTVLMVDPVAK